MHKKALSILFSFFIFGGTCFAHANEYTQDAGSKHSSEFGHDNSQSDNMYAVSDDHGSSGDLLDHSLDRTDFLAPTHETEPDMKHDEGSHPKHVDIKIAEHKLVSTSQKGYGPAAGITLVAGLVFGIVVMRRS